MVHNRKVEPDLVNTWPRSLYQLKTEVATFSGSDRAPQANLLPRLAVRVNPEHSPALPDVRRSVPGSAAGVLDVQAAHRRDAWSQHRGEVASDELTRKIVPAGPSALQCGP